MLCPCCGGDMEVGARECGCGARFVGSPLDGAQIKVQRFGPAIMAILLFAAVVGSALIFTKFLALAGVLVIWVCLRAMRLARHDPDGYGGYRVAAGMLAVTLVVGSVASGYAIAYVPRFLKNREERQAAATRARIFHVYKLIEDHKRTFGSYPRVEAISKAINEPLPKDFWENTIRYEGYTDSMAEVVEAGRNGRPANGIPINNFELRSSGPDGKPGTDDDIIMCDGIFYTNSEVKKLSIMKSTISR